MSRWLDCNQFAGPVGSSST